MCYFTGPMRAHWLFLANKPLILEFVIANRKYNRSSHGFAWRPEAEIVLAYKYQLSSVPVRFDSKRLVFRWLEFNNVNSYPRVETYKSIVLGFWGVSFSNIRSNKKCQTFLKFHQKESFYVNRYAAVTHVNFANSEAIRCLHVCNVLNNNSITSFFPLTSGSFKIKKLT